MLPQHDSLGAAEHVPVWIGMLPLIAGLLGIATAYVCYIGRARSSRRGWRTRFRALYLFLLNKWYFDELYDRALRAHRRWRSATGCGRPATARSSTGSGPTGSPPRPASWRARRSRLQTGYVYHYAFAMLIGVVALVTWYLLPRSGERRP